MDMETNSHCYSSERLTLDHFDLLELLRVQNAHEGQTCQVAMRVVFLPFNDGKIILNGHRIWERYLMMTCKVRTRCAVSEYRKEHDQ